MRHGVFGLICACVLLTAPSPAHGQGASTSSLSGTVTDASGAVLPGADVTVRNNGTSASFTAVTGPTGTFTVPALDAGSYSVTVTMMGFKTVNPADVRVNAATPASVRVTLEVGELAETITVQGQSSEVVQTRTAAVQTTLDINQISNLPLTSRNAFEFVTFLPGVQTARNDGLNANTWFNNRDLPPDPATGKAPKTELLLNQAGFRAGGPIVIPGLWDGHNKGFFFMMYEHTRQPQKVTRDNNPDQFRVTGLSGADTSRIVQLVTRVSW